MTTAHHRPGAHGVVARWTRAAVIALVAVLAVLVHHETAAMLTHVSPTGISGNSSMAGMHHTATPIAPAHASGHAAPPGLAAPAAIHDDDGACSGTAMQHCSAAGVDSLKLVPPHRPALEGAAVAHPGAAVGRDVPGASSRAPPDLPVLLSRFLL
ncbi:hypothetical protein GCM10010269_50130 [Streptomyces humidus]|uniref:Uncharacterized protein n=1 Tax=Streptomyces humidus TaxID=52259 RepID=A0A918G050_9ACTN|nr:hypothetical protein [Streptomyces humidus]GGS05261.1 hypothetical protein GCM10010269_50130 [Streptomyces humidus]